MKDDGGNIWAAISVIPSKEVGKRDIWLIYIQDGKIYVRSITELLNLLYKKKVSFDNRKKVVDFLAYSLMFLERNER